MLILIVIATVHAEAATRLEKVRRRLFLGDPVHVDFTSIWTFPGVLLLPPELAAVAAAIIISYVRQRVLGPKVVGYKACYGTAVVGLSAAASAAFSEAALGGARMSFISILGTALVYYLINSVLIALAVAIASRTRDLQKIWGNRDDNLLELGTLSLGGVSAAAFVLNPLLWIFFLPVLPVLHRAVLSYHLKEAGSTDAKTGLLNAPAWYVEVGRRLRRRREASGVLILDLDHFKRVNDTYGHLAGDLVLYAVADAMRAEVRDQDLVGRFGGEEFVVLLAGLPHGSVDELEAVAERIRRRVAGLRVEVSTPDGPLTIENLTVSIGAVLTSPAVRADLRTLLQVADTALYSAKRDGRNMVRIGLAAAVPAQRRLAATENARWVHPVGGSGSDR